MEAEKVLKTFAQLDPMDRIHRAPVLHTCAPTTIKNETFANLLRELYESSNGPCEYDWRLDFSNYQSQQQFQAYTIK